jgi:hypothetical protein
MFIAGRVGLFKRLRNQSLKIEVFLVALRFEKSDPRTDTKLKEPDHFSDLSGIALSGWVTHHAYLPHNLASRFSSSAISSVKSSALNRQAQLPHSLAGRFIRLPRPVRAILRLKDS